MDLWLHQALMVAADFGQLISAFVFKCHVQQIYQNFKMRFRRFAKILSETTDYYMFTSLIIDLLSCSVIK